MDDGVVGHHQFATPNPTPMPLLTMTIAFLNQTRENSSLLLLSAKIPTRLHLHIVTITDNRLLVILTSTLTIFRRGAVRYVRFLLLHLIIDRSFTSTFDFCYCYGR